MAEMKDQSSMFSLQALYEMEADRVRGDTIRQLAEQQRREEERRLVEERRLIAERERAARLEREGRQAAERVALARIAEEVRVRELSRAEHERELREVAVRHEQLLSEHRRDARIVRLRRWALGSALATLLVGGVAGALVARASSEHQELARTSAAELARATSQRDVDKEQLARAASERERLEERLRERDRALTLAVAPPAPEAPRNNPASTRLPRRPLRPPVVGSKQPCVGDVNDPLNPCLPH